ncbi:MAG: aromatic amino acid transport family protein [Candidatus Pacearchaeota archaeon]
MVKKKLSNPVSLIAGTAMGAGFLGLPYIIAKTGFLIGFIYLILIGLFVLFVQLCLGEIILRTKGNSQLTGYAKRYLGNKGKKLTLFIMIFYIFSTLIAYIIGGGESLSYIFSGTNNYALLFSIIFWILLSILTYIGLRALKLYGKVGFYFILGFIFLIILFYTPSIKMDNLTFVEPENFFFPFGIVLFSFTSFSSIPSAKRLLLGKENWMKKSIILGVLIPFVVYSLFTLVLLGNFGKQVPEIATLALGRGFAVLGAIAIFTSYLSLNISLRDMFRFDFNVKRNHAWLICSIAPIIMFLIIHFFKLASFVQILSFAGVVTGGSTGILILVMNFKSKQKGKRIPEYSVPLNKIAIFLLSLVFIFGIVIQLGGEKIVHFLKLIFNLI